MKCPACDVTLVMADRQGIEIDYCPQCRGVWLDRGELDKIIERTAGLTAPAAAPTRTTTHHPSPSHPHPSHTHGGDYYRHKKKKSLLDDLFDF